LEKGVTRSGFPLGGKKNKKEEGSLTAEEGGGGRGKAICFITR